MAITVEITDQARPALKRLEVGFSSAEFRGEIGKSVANRVARISPPVAEPPGLSHDRFLAARGGGHEIRSPARWRERASIRSVCGSGISRSTDPVRGKYLTIPAPAEAYYGHAAMEFSDLKFFRRLLAAWFHARACAV